MSKIRRILLKGMSGDEKLAIISKYVRLLVKMGKRDPDIYLSEQKGYARIIDN